MALIEDRNDNVSSTEGGPDESVNTPGKAQGPLEEADANHTDDSKGPTLDLMLKGHPAGLCWDDVIGLITQIGRVSSHVDGTFLFEVNDRKASFKRPPGDVMPDYAIASLRTFLDKAEVEVPIYRRPETTIVVIDHHSARLVRSAHGAGRTAATEEPYDPHGFHRHLIHRREAHYEGDRIPEDLTFFERIAQDLIEPGLIVILAHGQSKSDEGGLLLAYLQKHHPQVANKIIAIEHLDLSALSEPQIEAQIRKHVY